MKTNKLFLIAVAALAGAFVSCGGGGGNGGNQNAPEASVKIDVGEKPLNISVYLDLSDRIVKGTDEMAQTEKDTAIVNHIVDIFYSNAVQKKEKLVVDRMNVFFYPTPTLSGVSQLAKDLKVDLGATNNKLGALTTMKDKIQENLGKIYDQAVQSQEFLGSDLWGFFNEQAEVQCLAKEYRNILVILTDGYVYHQNNIVPSTNPKPNECCSFISPTTLKNGNPLLVGCNGLDDLEVLVLEANPEPNTDFPKLKIVLENWLKGMGVKKCRVVKTDIPTTTFQSIDKFFEE